MTTLKFSIIITVHIIPKSLKCVLEQSTFFIHLQGTLIFVVENQKVEQINKSLNHYGQIQFLKMIDYTCFYRTQMNTICFRLTMMICQVLLRLTFPLITKWPQVWSKSSDLTGKVWKVTDFIEISKVYLTLMIKECHQMKNISCQSSTYVFFQQRQSRLYDKLDSILFQECDQIRSVVFTIFPAPFPNIMRGQVLVNTWITCTAGQSAPINISTIVQ